MWASVAIEGSSVLSGVWGENPARDTGRVPRKDRGGKEGPIMGWVIVLMVGMGCTVGALAAIDWRLGLAFAGVVLTVASLKAIREGL